MTWLFLSLIAIQIWANPVQWDPRILDSPLSSVGFSQSNVLEINRNVRRTQPEYVRFTRLSVRDLVKLPKSQFAYHMLRNEIQQKLAELGLVLEMTDAEIRLFEKYPSHFLFQPISVLSTNVNESTLIRLRGNRWSRRPLNLIVLDLVKAQSRAIPHSLPRVSPVVQVQIAKALDYKLGTDSAFNLNRYIRYPGSPELVERMAAQGIRTILDLLNISESELLVKNVFSTLAEVQIVTVLRRQFRGLIDPDCGDHLASYVDDDE